MCRRVGFKPRIVKEADGAASALAFVAAGFGVPEISEPLQKIATKNVIFRDLAPEDSAKPDALTAPVASQFIDVLAQSCANGNAWRRAAPISPIQSEPPHAPTTSKRPSDMGFLP
jgi:hypothetical protein